MATPYSSVYSFFLQKINDYSFLNLSTADLNNLMRGYLRTACTRFTKCQKDLTQYDDTAEQFTATLTDQEMDILGTLMLIEYFNPKVNSLELLRQSFTNRDWSQTSQANHLKQLKDIRDGLTTEAETLIVRYTYENVDLSGSS